MLSAKLSVGYLLDSTVGTAQILLQALIFVWELKMVRDNGTYDCPIFILIIICSIIYVHKPGYKIFSLNIIELGLSLFSKFTNEALLSNSSSSGRCSRLYSTAF